MYKGKVVKTATVKCSCGHEWFPKKSPVLRCPRCFKRF